MPYLEALQVSQPVLIYCGSGKKVIFIVRETKMESKCLVGHD